MAAGEADSSEIEHEQYLNLSRGASGWDKRRRASSRGSGPAALARVSPPVLIQRRGTARNTVGDALRRRVFSGSTTG